MVHYARVGQHIRAIIYSRRDRGLSRLGSYVKNRREGELFGVLFISVFVDLSKCREMEKCRVLPLQGLR